MSQLFSLTPCMLLDMHILFGRNGEHAAVVVYHCLAVQHPHVAVRGVCCLAPQLGLLQQAASHSTC
jgi:hypothetical protein